MRILNTQQMREADRRTIQEIGLSSLVLMENAGRQVVAATESTYPDLEERRVAVLCGRGNNGGDGFVAARHLARTGAPVVVAFVASEGRPKGRDAAKNWDRLSRLDGVTIDHAPVAQS